MAKSRAKADKKQAPPPMIDDESVPLPANNTELATELDRLRHENAGLMNKLQAALDRNAELEEEVAAANAMIEEAAEDATRQVAELQAKLTALNEAITSEENRLRAVQSATINADEAHEQARKRLNATKEDVTTLKTELRELRRSIATDTSLKKGLEAKLAALTAEVKLLEVRFEDFSVIHESKCGCVAYVKKGNDCETRTMVEITQHEPSLSDDDFEIEYI